MIVRFITINRFRNLSVAEKRQSYVMYVPCDRSKQFHQGSSLAKREKNPNLIKLVVLISDLQEITREEQIFCIVPEIQFEMFSDRLICLGSASK